MSNNLKILCIHKHEHKKAQETAIKMIKWCKKNNVACSTISSHALREEFIEHATNCHAVIVIGGDGSMLATARALYDVNIPLFGINYGRVGFIMEAEPRDWKKWIKRIVSNLYEMYFGIPCEEEKLFLESHSLFVCSVMRKNELVYTGYAVNDAVIARGGIARTISLSLIIDNNLLSSLRCDGLIISTPLGATAYAIAAHGPLALPGVDAQIITPICPFAGAFPPCVVAGSAKVCIAIDDSRAPAILTLDGQENFPLEEKDTVHITSYHNKINLLVGNKAWYVERLVQRGYIRPGPGVKEIEKK